MKTAGFLKLIFKPTASAMGRAEPFLPHQMTWRTLAWCHPPPVTMSSTM